VESMRLMLLASGVSAALSIGIVVAIVAVRVLRAMRRRRDTRRCRVVEPMLYRALELGVVPRALRRLRARDLELLSQQLVEMLASLRGAQQQQLVELAAEAGLVQRDLRGLASRGYRARARAAENLGFYGGAEHTAALAPLLEDPEEAVRAVAARALSRIGTVEAANALVAHLTSASELTSMRMAENLERIGDLAAPRLTELLSSEQQADRRGQALAARILGNLRVAEAREGLGAVLGRRWNADLRAQATLALGKIGHPGDVPTLMAATRDGSWPVRVQAATALGLVGDVSTVPVLRRLVGDDQWWVRVSAAQALANMGGAGEAALTELLRGADQPARRHAASALGPSTPVLAADVVGGAA
jgi:HEAT repeat protein